MPKKKKRKLRVDRLVLLLGVLLIGITVIGFGCTWAWNQMFASSNVVMASETSLGSLKGDIQDVFAKESLSSLKGEIEDAFVDRTLEPLKEQIEQYLKDNNINPDQIGWAVQDLRTDNFIESENAKDDFVAASTYKLPAMMLWMEKIADGSAHYEDKIKLTRNMLEMEDEENPEQPIGKKYNLDEEVPLYELLQAGAIYSDNLAGHMMFSGLGGYEEYKKQAQKYSSTKQSDAFFDESQNILNPHYTMDLAHYLYTTPDVFDDLKYWLYLGGYGMFLDLNTQHGYIQKLGNINEVRNVIGYYPGEFPFSISIYSAIDRNKGEQHIANIGDIAYNFFQNLYNSGYYETVDGRDPIYTYWQLGGQAPENIFADFDMDTPNKANSQANIEMVFGKAAVDQYKRQAADAEAQSQVAAAMEGANQANQAQQEANEQQAQQQTQQAEQQAREAEQQAQQQWQQAMEQAMQGSYYEPSADDASAYDPSAWY